MAAPETSILESVIGCSGHEPLLDALVRSYQTLICPGATAEDLFNDLRGIDALHGGADVPMSPDESDLSISLASAQEAYSGQLRQENPLVSWPVYQHLLNTYGRRLEGGNALLVGAMTAMTTRAAERLALEEYGADRSIVVDLTPTKHKARHGTFVAADALRLPFSDESVQLVHTSQLLHMLENPQDPDAPRTETYARFFSEIFRVLAPDGQLLMRETTPDLPKELPDCERDQRRADFGRSLIRLTQEAGFRDTITEQTAMPDTIAYLTDPTRDFGSYGSLRAFGTFSVYARKMSSL